jgi:hypothetical protein
MKSPKKASSKRKKAPSKRQDLLLATILGVLVVTVGLVVTRYSEASSQQKNSFNRDPITQMQGGQVVKKSTGQQVRLASQVAPGVDAVYTLVSQQDMAKTAQVCVDYQVKQKGTFINVTYNSPAGGLATSRGTMKNSGNGTECVVTNGKAVAGTININVSPGLAQIVRMYGLPLTKFPFAK